MIVKYLIKMYLSALMCAVVQNKVAAPWIISRGDNPCARAVRLGFLLKLALPAHKLNIAWRWI